MISVNICNSRITESSGSFSCRHYRFVHKQGTTEQHNLFCVLTYNNRQWSNHFGDYNKKMNPILVLMASNVKLYVTMQWPTWIRLWGHKTNRSWKIIASAPRRMSTFELENDLKLRIELMDPNWGRKRKLDKIKMPLIHPRNKFKKKSTKEKILLAIRLVTFPKSSLYPTPKTNLYQLN